MGNRYSFTDDGLKNLALYNVTPAEVWTALHAKHRMTRYLGTEAAAIFAMISTGRYLVVLVLESTSEDNDWDIVAARDMSADEIRLFSRYAGGRNE